MNSILFISSIVIILSIFLNKTLSKFGVPTLIIFIALGMIFGSDGIFGIYFDNFSITQDICTIGLVFIIFYGGFSTKWSIAKPVVTKSILLSTIGVILTALFTTIFLHFILNVEIYQSFLLSVVISSTDAASLFSILRSKKLNLKNGLASLLEIESGSNDPMAFTLMIIALSLMTPTVNISIGYLIFAQIFFGILFGFIVASISLLFFRRINLESSGLYTICMIAIAFLSYSLPIYLDGNGFLSVYITGVILGNKRIKNKKEIVQFFDATSGLTEIAIFFMLGLLSFPSKIMNTVSLSIYVALFLIFVARPLTVAIMLTPFKVSFKEQILVSLAGLRGASSIAFAIYAVSELSKHSIAVIDVYHIVFFISLISVSFQGAILPLISKKLNLIDNKSSVMKTFTDYQESYDMKLVELIISENHKWIGKTVKDLSLPPDSLIVMIKRDNQTLIPKGNTTINENDVIVLNIYSYPELTDVKLKESFIKRGHHWENHQIKDIKLPDSSLIVLIKRDNETVIPKGNTVIKKGDTIVISGDCNLLD